MTKTQSPSRLLVGVDFSATDAYVYKMISYLDQIYSLDQIYLVHVIRDLHHVYYEGVDKSLPIDEALRERMRQESMATISGVCANIDYLVVEGELGTELLKWQKVKQADLVVLGRKHKFEDTHLHGILNLCPCSICFVPTKEITFPIQNMILPINGSQESVIAMNFALDFVAQTPPLDPVRLEVVSAYTVPQGYSYSGKSDKDFKEIMRKNQLAEIDAFFKANEWEQKIAEKHLIYVDFWDGVADELAQQMKQMDAECLVVGTQARTRITQFFMGTKVRRMIERIDDKIIFAAKDPSKTFDLLDVINNI